MTRRKSRRRQLSIEAQAAKDAGMLSKGIPVTFETVQNKTATVEGVPIEAVRAAIPNTAQSYVKFYRRNEKGRLSALTTRMVETKDLLDIEEYMKAEFGGGWFYVQAFLPDDHSMLLVPGFNVSIDGLPKPVNKLGTTMGMNEQGNVVVNTMNGPIQVTPEQAVKLGVLPAPGTTPYGQPAMQSENMALPNYVHPNYLQHMNPVVAAGQQFMAPAPGASMASDAVLQQVRREQAEQFAAREAETKAHMERLEAQNQQLVDQLARDREAARETERKMQEDRHKVEMQALRDQIKLAMEVKNAPPPPPVEKPDYSKLLAAAAPIVVAYLTAGRDTNTEAQRSQDKMMQLFMTQLASKPDSTAELMKMIAMLGPVVAPILVKMVDQKGPEAQAQLFQNLAESSMQQLGMTAQFVQTMSEMQSKDGAPPWWLPMIENGMKGVMDIVAAASAMKKVQQGPPVRQMVQSTVRPVQQATVEQTPTAATAPAPQNPLYATVDSMEAPQGVNTAEVQVPTPVVEEPPQNGQMHKPSPEVATKFVMANLPAHLQGKEWERVIFMIHSETPPREVAETLVALLGHLERFGLLPPEAEQILKDPATHLDNLIAQLPIYAYSPDYCKLVVEATVHELKLAQEGDSDDIDYDGVTSEESHQAEVVA